MYNPLMYMYVYMPSIDVYVCVYIYIGLYSWRSLVQVRHYEEGPWFKANRLIGMSQGV